MGWLWSTPAPASSLQQGSNLPTPPQTSTEQLPSTSNPAPAEKQLSREDAEQELTNFLKEFDTNVNPSSTKYNRVPRNPPLSTHQPPSQSQSQNVASSSQTTLAEQLLPTTMGCRTAFDEAFYCNSFGGRWNDLYRYGTIKSCSDNWNDFWFCMRTRTHGDAQRAAAIKEHYRQKEITKYSKNLGRESSEDVWKSRERKVKWGDAFAVKFEDFEGSDEEWRRRELERRQGAVDGSMG